jgi:hypothetical protein
MLTDVKRLDTRKATPVYLCLSIKKHNTMIYIFQLIGEGRVIDTVIAPDQESAALKAAFRYGDMAAFMRVKKGKPFQLPQ